MSAATLTELLRQHPFVEGFVPAHIDKLGALARAVAFARDDIVFREGDFTHEFFLITKGRISLEIQEPDDHVLRVQVLGPGDEFGWSSMLAGRGRFFLARALEPTEALAFDGPTLLEACRKDPAFGFAFMYRMLGVVSERLQAARLQLHDMYSLRAKRSGA